MTPADVIRMLDLQPLLGEGGYYRETYRSPLRWTTGISGEKALATAIYYLLTVDTFSRLHRLPSDEVYHYYLGQPVRMLQLYPDGTGRATIIGADIARGQHVQWLVPAGVWQGSILEPGGSFALLGTTMSPGFDFSDFEAGNGALLRRQYPEYTEFIDQLTAPD